MQCCLFVICTHGISIEISSNGINGRFVFYRGHKLDPGQAASRCNSVTFLISFLPSLETTGV